jgi:hypothetical protein
MRSYIRRRLVVLTALMSALLLVVAAAGAASGGTPALGVTIVSHVTFNPDGPNFGDFSASGPAVDAGAMCAAGTFVDTGIKFAGYQSATAHVQLQVTKDFTCDNGSGTFAVKLQINADINTGYESFAWVASGTSGDLASLQGAGTGSTVPNRPIGNTNTYVGMITG